MAIYTKRGRGQTKVFDKKSGALVEVPKDSRLIRTIGAIDELNAFLGIVISEVGSQISDARYQKENIKKIQEIQGNLFTINSILAGSKLRFTKSKIKKLEKEIDYWEGTLPVQKNFIYYGGNKIASQLFYARALCRRAECSLVLYFRQQPTTNNQLLVCLNRLSDYLFILARGINFNQRIKEEYWKGQGKMVRSVGE